MLKCLKCNRGQTMHLKHFNRKYFVFVLDLYVYIYSLYEIRHLDRSYLPHINDTYSYLVEKSHNKSLLLE